MTAQELLAVEGIDKTSIGVGHTLSLHAKLDKHLRSGDDSRVRDYLIVIRCIWPNLDVCPIDVGILKKAVKFLKLKGWKIYLHENHDDRISQYIRRT
ncbi:MAG: hypothetical protein PHI24_09180 [Desulfitobacteriaceae bacterium]|nr:hypothetical protein [Desulfitobacteriaceae bacterium]